MLKIIIVSQNETPLALKGGLSATRSKPFGNCDGFNFIAVENDAI